MKCMVRWENQGDWRGPFEVYGYGEDWVKLSVKDSCYPTVPRDWTLGIDDGWTIWDGGECPVSSAKCEVFFRGSKRPQVVLSVDVRWDHMYSSGDIIAYQIVERPKQTATKLTPLSEELKTLDQAWDEEEPSLAEILNDWWLGDDNVFKRVDAWDVESSEAPFHLWLSGFVPRDWFTGRRHLTSDELAEEMEG